MDRQEKGVKNINIDEQRSEFMLLQFLSWLSGLWFMFLHVSGSGSFPKALSSAEERECLRRMKKGDGEARRMLIEHNLRLVAHVVKKYYPPAGEQDDLISIGTIGLIKAIDSFDPDKGIRLSSYASKCVENEVLMHFRAQKKTAQDISINEPIDTDKDGNTLTLMDTMSSDEDIIDDIDMKIRSGKLYGYLIDILDDREKKILISRYGLFGTKPMTQREVAKSLGISRSYISRIEKQAIEKLRKRFSEK